MTDEELFEITDYWSFWNKEVPQHHVSRQAGLPKKLSDSLVLVIQGVRRAGKSTLLTQMVRDYRLPAKHCAFLNFEDPRLGASLDHRLLQQWVDVFRRKHSRVKRLYFFLDEIQSVQGWQKWLCAQLERPSGNHFVVTGSNAQLLSGELSSALTGRHQSIELFPFDLDEYHELRPQSDLSDFLTEGGFPEPLQQEDGDRLRMHYFTDIVGRDIRERLGARSSATIKQVVQMVFETAGSEMSLRRIAGATGLAVETAASYLEACEAAYLLFACPYFAFSERKRASRNKKYYPIDTGLRRMVVTRTGHDRGKMFECAVYLALRRMGADISYWRGKGEVDFVVRTRGTFVPIQVSWEGPCERHHRALEEFYETFPQAEEAIFVGPDEYESGLFLRTIFS